MNIVTLILSIILSFDANDRDISIGPNITQVKQSLETDGFVLIPGKDMKKLLIQHGASDDDMAVLESGYIHKHLKKKLTFQTFITI